jgi:hypothetical protein
MPGRSFWKIGQQPTRSSSAVSAQVILELNTQKRHCLPDQALEKALGLATRRFGDRVGERRWCNWGGQGVAQPSRGGMPGASRFGTTAGGCTGRMLTPSSDASSGMGLERWYVQGEEELTVAEGSSG